MLGENVTAYKICGIVVSCCSILLLGTKDVRQLLVCVNKKSKYADGLKRDDDDEGGERYQIISKDALMSDSERHPLLPVRESEA